MPALDDSSLITATNSFYILNGYSNWEEVHNILTICYILPKSPVFSQTLPKRHHSTKSSQLFITRRKNFINLICLPLPDGIGVTFAPGILKGKRS